MKESEISAALEEGPLREAAILTRAVENVFRKLIRLLIGRMSLAKLQEMIRFVYVEEAKSKLEKEKPGKKVAMTNLAISTGLDSRTVQKVLNETKGFSHPRGKSTFLKGITPESSILDVWSSNARYLDPGTRTPLVLKTKGEFPSFESLVKDASTSRGVTAKSLLESLVASKSVKIDKEDGTVELLSRQYLYFKNEQMINAIEAGLASVSNLLETLVHNFSDRTKPLELFFERSNWSHRLNLKSVQQVRSELRSHLMTAEEMTVNILSSFEEDESHEDQFTAGVCMFYFEESPYSG